MAKITPFDVDSYRVPEAGFGDPRGRVPYDVLRAAAWGTDYNGPRNAIAQALTGPPPGAAPAPGPQMVMGGGSAEQAYLNAIGWQGTDQQYYQSLGLLPGGTPSPQVAAQARQASGGAWPGNIGG